MRSGARISVATCGVYGRQQMWNISKNKMVMKESCAETIGLPPPVAALCPESIRRIGRNMRICTMRVRVAFFRLISRLGRPSRVAPATSRRLIDLSVRSLCRSPKNSRHTHAHTHSCKWGTHTHTNTHHSTTLKRRKVGCTQTRRATRDGVFSCALST